MDSKQIQRYTLLFCRIIYNNLLYKNITHER